MESQGHLGSSPPAAIGIACVADEARDARDDELLGGGQKRRVPEVKVHMVTMAWLNDERTFSELEMACRLEDIKISVKQAGRRKGKQELLDALQDWVRTKEQDSRLRMAESEQGRAGSPLVAEAEDADVPLSKRRRLTPISFVEVESWCSLHGCLPCMETNRGYADWLRAHPTDLEVLQGRFRSAANVKRSARRRANIDACAAFYAEHGTLPRLQKSLSKPTSSFGTGGGVAVLEALRSFRNFHGRRPLTREQHDMVVAVFHEAVRKACALPIACEHIGQITKAYHGYLHEFGYSWTSTEFKEHLTDFRRCLDMMSVLPISPDYIQVFIDALPTLQQDLGLCPSGNHSGERLDIITGHSSLSSNRFPGVGEFSEAEEHDLALLRGTLRKALLESEASAVFQRMSYVESLEHSLAKKNVELEELQEKVRKVEAELDREVAQGKETADLLQQASSLLIAGPLRCQAAALTAFDAVPRTQEECSKPTFRWECIDGDDIVRFEDIVNLDDTMPQRGGYGLFHHQGRWYPVSCISSATALGDSEDESMTEENVEIRKEEKEEVRVDVADGGIRTKEEFEEVYGGLQEWYAAPGYHKGAKREQEYTGSANVEHGSQGRSVNRSHVWVCISPPGRCSYMRFGDICELDDSMPRRGKFGLFRCAGPDGTGSNWFAVEKMSFDTYRNLLSNRQCLWMGGEWRDDSRHHDLWVKMGVIFGPRWE